jgi:hypothetical protein
VDRDGSLRISGSVDALFAGVPAGPWEIAVAVGRPENLPASPRDVLRARDLDATRAPRDASPDAGAAAWHLVVQRVLVGG